MAKSKSKDNQQAEEMEQAVSGVVESYMTLPTQAERELALYDVIVRYAGEKAREKSAEEHLRKSTPPVRVVNV